MCVCVWGSGADVRSGAEQQETELQQLFILRKYTYAKDMPSAFIREQADLLHRTKDAKLVLSNLRNKYALSSFPSQMSRVKVEWCKFGERHEDFQKSMESVYKTVCEPDSACSKKAVRELKQYIRDDLITQMRKCNLAKSYGGLTGNSNLDKVICKVPLIPDYMKEYRLTVEDRASSSNLARKSLETRSMDCVVIADADAVLARCVEKIKENKDSVFVLAACLSLVCGRRSIELLKTGEFSEASEIRGPYACIFSGAAKKKKVCEDRCEIPLMIKYKYFKPALRRVREGIPCESLTNSQINSHYSHKLGDAAKIITNNMQVRFHDLRCIYGVLSHMKFENSCSINVWLKLCLCHEALDTSMFYSRCKIEKCERGSLGRWDF